MRVFLTIILPILAPTLLFVGWTVARQGRPPGLRDAAWIWPIVAGLALMAAAAALFGFDDRAPPGSVYVPAQMQDGQLVPGQLEPGR